MQQAFECQPAVTHMLCRRQCNMDMQEEPWPSWVTDRACMYSLLRTTLCSFSKKHVCLSGSPAANAGPNAEPAVCRPGGDRQVTLCQKLHCGLSRAAQSWQGPPGYTWGSNGGGCPRRTRLMRPGSGMRRGFHNRSGRGGISHKAGKSFWIVELLLWCAAQQHTGRPGLHCRLEGFHRCL